MAGVQPLYAELNDRSTALNRVDRPANCCERLEQWWGSKKQTQRIQRLLFWFEVLSFFAKAAALVYLFLQLRRDVQQVSDLNSNVSALNARVAAIDADSQSLATLVAEIPALQQTAATFAAQTASINHTITRLFQYQLSTPYTPVLSGSQANGTIHYAAATGWYSKIGTSVTYTFYISAEVSGTPGGFLQVSMPFRTATNGLPYYYGVAGHSNLGSGYAVAGLVWVAQSGCQLMLWDNTGSALPQGYENDGLVNLVSTDGNKYNLQGSITFPTSDDQPGCA